MDEDEYTMTDFSLGGDGDGDAGVSSSSSSLAGKRSRGDEDAGDGGDDEDGAEEGEDGEDGKPRKRARPRRRRKKGDGDDDEDELKLHFHAYSESVKKLFARLARTVAATFYGRESDVVMRALLTFPRYAATAEDIADKCHLGVSQTRRALAKLQKHRLVQHVGPKRKTAEEEEDEERQGYKKVAHWAVDVELFVNVLRLMTSLMLDQLNAANAREISFTCGDRNCLNSDESFSQLDALEIQGQLSLAHPDLVKNHELRCARCHGLLVETAATRASANRNKEGMHSRFNMQLEPIITAREKLAEKLQHAHEEMEREWAHRMAMADADTNRAGGGGYSRVRAGASSSASARATAASSLARNMDASDILEVKIKHEVDVEPEDVAVVGDSRVLEAAAGASSSSAAGSSSISADVGDGLPFLQRHSAQVQHRLDVEKQHKKKEEEERIRLQAEAQQRLQELKETKKREEELVKQLVSKQLLNGSASSAAAGAGGRDGDGDVLMSGRAADVDAGVGAGAGAGAGGEPTWRVGDRVVCTSDLTDEDLQQMDPAEYDRYTAATGDDVLFDI